MCSPRSPLALMIQQFTAIEWSTEPQPFPRIVGRGFGLDEKFWLPLLACAAVILGLELLYRRTLVGRAFLAIAEDNYAARALGLPERNLRMASFALAGAIAGLAGFAGGQLLLASIANGPMLNFYGFVPVALGGLGNNRGAVVGGLAARPVSAGGELPVRRRARLGRGVCGLHRRPDGGAAGPVWGAADAARLMRFACRCPAAMLLIFAGRRRTPAGRRRLLVVIATRAAIYWVLVSGLNLVVGFAGQLAIGWVSLLTIGAYTTSVLVARGWLGPLPALAAAGVVGALAGVLVGLPALRLRTFYFAMTTLGFATIVTQVALAWTDVTGGGIGIAGPTLPAPLDSQTGFYLFCLALAALCTWMTLNIAASRFGRALVGLRDAEVAAEAMGISKAHLLVTVFLFSGASAAVAGGLFATLQSYITPDAFTFDLSVLFFIAILIGGRGSVLGPLLGAILLTALPEFAAPAGRLVDFPLRRPAAGDRDRAARRDRRPARSAARRKLPQDRLVVPRPDLVPSLITRQPDRPALRLSACA